MYKPLKRFFLVFLMYLGLSSMLLGMKKKQESTSEFPLLDNLAKVSLRQSPSTREWHCLNCSVETSDRTEALLHVLKKHYDQLWREGKIKHPTSRKRKREEPEALLGEKNTSNMATQTVKVKVLPLKELPPKKVLPKEVKAEKASAEEVYTSFDPQNLLHMSNELGLSSTSLPSIAPSVAKVWQGFLEEEG